MDYEKAYKDIIAKIKNAHLYAQTDSTKNVLEKILPELTESEDERIRKDLISYIKDLNACNLSGGERINKWLSWLEKQREPQPLSVSFGETDDAHLNAIEYVLEHSGIDNGIKNQMCAWLERQKEQKPAVWKLRKGIKGPICHTPRVNGFTLVVGQYEIDINDLLDKLPKEK